MTDVFHQPKDVEFETGHWRFFTSQKMVNLRLVTCVFHKPKDGEFETGDWRFSPAK